MIWINSFAEGSFYSSVVLHGGKVDSEAARYCRFEADPAHARARVAHLHRFRRHGPGINSVTPLRSIQTLKVQGSTRCKLSICMRDVEQSVVRECFKPFTEWSLSLLSHPLLQFSQTPRKGHTVPRHWKVLSCVLIITFS